MANAGRARARPPGKPLQRPRVRRLRIPDCRLHDSARVPHVPPTQLAAHRDAVEAVLVAAGSEHTSAVRRYLQAAHRLIERRRAPGVPTGDTRPEHSTLRRGGTATMPSPDFALASVRYFLDQLVRAGLGSTRRSGPPALERKAARSGNPPPERGVDSLNANGRARRYFTLDSQYNGRAPLSGKPRWVRLRMKGGGSSHHRGPPPVHGGCGGPFVLRGGRRAPAR